MIHSGLKRVALDYAIGSRSVVRGNDEHLSDKIWLTSHCELLMNVDEQLMSDDDCLSDDDWLASEGWSIPSAARQSAVP